MEKADDGEKLSEKDTESFAQDELNNNETEHQPQAEEELNLGDTSILTTAERNALFQRGLEYERKDQLEYALKCYLGCIDGLKSRSLFVLLPQCLHNIAQIYRAQENYEQAIHFAQAEKLFYETSLIETEDIQKKIDEVSAGVGDGQQDLNDLNIQALMAEEYEHLAKLCLDKKQQQLALEYAGKSTKLNQAVYGRDHQKTKTSLNMFAALYAEVGKLQYSDSVSLLSESSTTTNSSDTTQSSLAGIKARKPSAGEPVSILRQRSEDSIQGDGDKSRKKQVHFHDSVEENTQQKDNEELASITVTLMVLAVCVAVLAAMGFWLYCSLDKNHNCAEYGILFRSWLRRVQYFFHSLTTSSSASSSTAASPKQM